MIRHTKPGVVSTPARDPDDLRQGTREVTKKVRLTDGEATLLATLAEDRDLTESEVLRAGLRLQERMRRRAANIEGLVELAEGPDPDKVRFELEG